MDDIEQAIVDPSNRLGRVPSPDDPKDYSIRSVEEVRLALAAVLPPRYRLTTPRYMGRYDQQESSCVGQSVTYAKIVQERRDRARYLLLNPLWLWHQSKVDDGIGQPGQDRGTYIRTALEVLRNVGHTQSSDPLNRALADPSIKIGAYYRVNTVAELKAAIHARGLVLLGQAWYQSWFAVGADGKLPEPDVEVGGHATAAYGWDDAMTFPWTDAKGGIWAVNSWRDSWGKAGDYAIPYELIGAGKAVDEAWRMEDAA